MESIGDVIYQMIISILIFIFALIVIGLINDKLERKGVFFKRIFFSWLKEIYKKVKK